MCGCPVRKEWVSSWGVQLGRERPYRAPKAWFDGAWGIADDVGSVWENARRMAYRLNQRFPEGSLEENGFKHGSGIDLFR